MNEDDDEFPNVNPDNLDEQLLYYWRLKGLYSRETAALGEERLKTLVREGLKLCVPLEIRDPQDVLRFLALNFLITPEQKKSQFLERVTRLFLENTDFSARRRLNMVYDHVVGRPAPNPEPDFGPWFVEIQP